MEDKTYRVGIVGATGISAAHPGAPPPPFAGEVRTQLSVSHAATVALLPNTHLAGICDLVPGLLDEFKGVWGDELPDTNTYTDFREMLATENLDILTVATPDNRHTEIVVDGVKAGVKGVLCEKPLATTLEDADRMIQLCADRSVPIHVNHTRRWSPLMHKVRDEIRTGLIGPLHTIVASHGGRRAMLLRSGTHFVDAICFFAESTPTQVVAQLEDGFDDWDVYRGDGGRDPANEPSAIGIINFENGVRAVYNGYKDDSTASDFIQLMGISGQVRLNMDVRGSAVVTKFTEGFGRSVTELLHPTQYQIQALPAAYTELIDVIEDGGTGVSTAVEARKSLQIVLGFLMSHHQGSRLVNVPQS